MGAFGYNIDYYTYQIYQQMVAQQIGQTAASMASNAATVEEAYAMYNAYNAGRILTEMELADGTVVGANVIQEVTLGGSQASSIASTTGKIAQAVDAGTYTAEGAEYAAMKGVGTAAAGTAEAGAGTFGSFVFGEVLPVVGAVATGAQIGLAIDSAVYSAHPDWWWYNVETWDNVLLGHDTMLPILHDTETNTTYITEDAFNQFMQAANNLGVFIPVGEWEIPQNPLLFEEGGTMYECLHHYALVGGAIKWHYKSGIYYWDCSYEVGQAIVIQPNANTFTIIPFSSTATGHAGIFNAKAYTGGYPWEGGTYDHGYNNVETNWSSSSPEITINGKSVYVGTQGSGTTTGQKSFTIVNENYVWEGPKPAVDNGARYWTRERNTIWFTEYGDAQEATEKTAQVTGIEIAPDAVIPAEPAAGVAVNYPNLWNNRKTTKGVKKDKTTGTSVAKDINWVPVAMPAVTDAIADGVEEMKKKIAESTATVFDEDQVPVVTGDLAQSDTGAYPEPEPGRHPVAFDFTVPDAITRAIDAITDPSSNPQPAPEPNPNPEPSPEPSPAPMPTPSPLPDPTNPDNPQPIPDPSPEGSGTTPVVVPPITDPDVGMVMPYNPTRSQLVTFSQWLWSTNFIDVIQKLFASPADAIINLMEIYVTPPTGSGTLPITCGYVSSGVSSKWINKRYTELDCGSVQILENYGNVFDYEFTDISLFLPFIGFVSLDVDAVMRSTVNVKYTIDVLTGTCLARVLVKRDSYTVHEYSFGGNCGVTLPWSSGSLAQVYSSLATGALALGLASTPAAAIMAAAHGVLGAKAQMTKSGGYGANQGAMDCKTPFIVLKKNMNAMPSAYWQYQGYPFHQTALLGTCKGFTKATNIHYSGPATAEEIEEIESILEKGIIL